MNSFACPLPNSMYDTIVLGHGGGGRLTQNLIEELFKPALNNPVLSQGHDAAIISVGNCQMAITIDAHVVRPIFFPGGDIGKLAVCGTVNDLAMCGAKPLYLSAAFILEEGFKMADLCRVVESVRITAKQIGVVVVAGDTKVVERGKGDGLYLVTAGLGVIEHGVEPLPKNIQVGDAIVVSGDIGRHGIAVLSEREGLNFETVVESDVDAVWPQVERLLNLGIPLHCMRDLTRGGLASVLNELALASGKKFEIQEDLVPIIEPVKAACEILGLDPLSIACEGRFVAFMPKEFTEMAITALKEFGLNASVIGFVKEGSGGVILQTSSGTRRILEMPLGVELPRIC